MNKILIDIPEIIETPNLNLHITCAGFGEKLHAAISDGYEDYIRWLNWPQSIPSVKMVEKECRKNHAEFILREFIRYIILEKETGQVIGRCAFPPAQTHWMIPQFGVSYFIKKSKRSKGYGTEAAHAMTLLAFQILGAKKVEIHCDIENIASSQIPLKLGFQPEYLQCGSWIRHDGQLAKLQTYSIFNESVLPKMMILYS